MTDHRFTLYIRSGSRTSIAAELNLRRILDESGVDGFELNLVDVVEDPQAADDAGILATPTLVREMPAPRRRIVGDLSESAIVRAALGLPAAYPAALGASG